MLTGEFNHTLDAKGRVFIPAKWREELKGEVFVTKGQERCLYLMTGERFAQRAEQLDRVSQNQKSNRDHNRIFFASASEEQVDRSGRMGIPQRLREYAGLEKEVVIVGVSGRAEIWSRTAWADYSERVEMEYEQVAAQLDSQTT